METSFPVLMEDVWPLVNNADLSFNVLIITSDAVMVLANRPKDNVP